MITKSFRVQLFRHKIVPRLNPSLSEEYKFTQIGIVHGAFGDCGNTSSPSPAIYVRLSDPQIINFIIGVLGATG